MKSTDPEFLKRRLEESTVGRSSQGSREMWRLKKDGEMNYDRKGLQNSRPDIVVGAYNRDFQRKNDTAKFYSELK